MCIRDRFYSGPIGNLPSPNGMDDCVYYDSENYVSIVYDSEGIDDGPVPGPYGLRMYPAEKRNVSGKERIELSEFKNSNFVVAAKAAL